MLPTSVAISLRYRLRGLLYGTRLGALLRRTVRRSVRGTARPRAAEHDDPAYWNTELAGRMATPNLNGRMNNELRDGTTRALVRQCGPAPVHVLDVGCAYGTLADALAPEGLERYVGIDLSDYVVERATAQHADRPYDARFVATDLRSFTPDPDSPPFDVIVFNEVLYYLEVEEAVGALRRAAAWLSPEGVFCVNMKDDPKCHAIYDRLGEAFRWSYGTIYQQRPDGPQYTLTISRASPAYLAGVLRPREAAA